MSETPHDPRRPELPDDTKPVAPGRTVGASSYYATDPYDRTDVVDFYDFDDDAGTTTGVDTAGIEDRLDAGEEDTERRGKFKDMVGRLAMRRAEGRAKKTHHRAAHSVDHDLSDSPKRLRGEPADGSLPMIPWTAPHGSNPVSKLAPLRDGVRVHYAPTADDLKKYDPNGNGGRATAEQEALRVHGLDYEDPDDLEAIAAIQRAQSPTRAAKLHDRASSLIEAQRVAEPSGSKRQKRHLEAREAILSEREEALQREMYQHVTGLSFDRDGNIQGSGVDMRWAAELNPHNIHALREAYIERFLASAAENQDHLHNKIHIPVAHLKAGNPRFLDDGLMAAYFGVSTEEWLAQKAGGREVVPEHVIDAVGHYLALNRDVDQGKVDEKSNSINRKDTLQLAMSVIPPVETHSPNDDPSYRIQDAEHVPEHVWRRELGYRSPALDPEQMDELRDLAPDLRYLQREIDAAARKEESDRKKKRRLAVLPKAEHDSIRNEVTELVLTGYLDGSSPDEIARYRMYLDLLSQQRR